MAKSPKKQHDQMQLGITATVTLIWLVSVIVCFLKWKTWTAIIGIIGLVVTNFTTTGMVSNYIMMGPAISLALLVVAIRLAKPVSWWAKWFYWGPLGPNRELLRPSPKLARSFARFPEQRKDFEEQMRKEPETQPRPSP